MMFFINSFLIPFLLGAIFIGSATERTILVYEGKVFLVGILSIIVSLSVYFNIHYVVEGKVFEFASFSFGTILATCLLAYRRKLLNIKKKDC